MVRQRSTEVREKILDAARDVLQDVGVEGFTVDEVVQRSGVAKTTIYRHFDTSMQLIVHALDSMVAPFPTPNTGSLRGDLTAYCEITSQLTCDPGLRRMMLQLLAAAAGDPELAKIKESLLSERMGPIRTMMELARARGEISADLEPQVAAELAEAPFLSHLALHGLDAPSDAQLARMVDFVVAGLTGMGASGDTSTPA